MRIRCTKNDLAQIRDTIVITRLKQSIHIDGPLEDLTIGKEHAVQALEKRSDEGLWVYVHTVLQSDFPYPYPIELFEIVESSVPQAWQVGSGSRRRDGIFRLSFREWANDDGFYEKLVNGESDAVQAYRGHFKVGQF